MRTDKEYTITRYDTETGKYEFKYIHPLNDCIDSINERFNDLIESNQSLQKRLKEIQDEKWADNKLQQMQEELERMRREYYRGFPIRDDEKAKIDQWMKNHAHPSGAIGGAHSYIFTPTSIGTVGKIKCMCGEEFTFVDL